MENLWAPWRMELIRKPPIKGCFFCYYHGQSEDEKNLVLERAKHGMVVMNRFPYNNGHLLVAPYRHTRDLNGLEAEERAGLMELLVRWQGILTEAMHPEGFNIGMNLGKVAGAGLEEHLHWHIIPRWNGDTSFIAVMSETKVINQHLEETYRELFASSQNVKSFSNRENSP